MANSTHTQTSDLIDRTAVEDVHMTVPIRREKVRLVPVPITDADRDAAVSGRADISEAQREVVVRQNVVDVDERIIPKERFRLETVVETDDVDVDESLHKERIEMNNVNGSPRRRGENVEDRHRRG